MTDAEQINLNGERGKLVMGNDTYDRLKAVAQFWLPAIGTLYFALATIWGLPYGAEVVGTITAIDVALGTILGISKKSYEQGSGIYDGALVIDETDPHRDIFSIEMNKPLDDISKSKTLSLKVDKGPATTSK